EGYIPNAANSSTAPASLRASSLPQSSRITCGSELVREGYIPNAANFSTAPASLRASSLL
ncbi:hypothetical protein ABNM51_05315, partial [Pseudomonas syringae]